MPDDINVYNRGEMGYTQPIHATLPFRGDNIKRAYYSASVHTFLHDREDLILGELTRHHQFSLEELQKHAWIEQVRILKVSLQQLPDCHVMFEYAIPRMGKRVDVVILYAGIVFVLEFKVGASGYTKAAVEQVLDYALDLKNFHESSHTKKIIPIVIATEAPSDRKSVV